MNTKLIGKWVGLLLLSVFFFCAGLFASAINQFGKSLHTPCIESETKARDSIHRVSNFELPDNATHLYYGRWGFVDALHYAAFSLSNAEACETFIKEQLDVKPEDFKEISELPDDFIEYGPDTWEQKYRDPAWDLKETDKYLLCTNGYVRAILYAPEKNRFYFRLR